MRPPADWRPAEGGHAAPGRTRTAERRAGPCRNEPLPPVDTCVHTPPGRRENSGSCLSKVTTAVTTSVKCRNPRSPAHIECLALSPTDESISRLYLNLPESMTETSRPNTRPHSSRSFSFLPRLAVAPQSLSSIVTLSSTSGLLPQSPARAALFHPSPHSFSFSSPRSHPRALGLS